MKSGEREGREGVTRSAERVHNSKTGRFRRRFDCDCSLLSYVDSLLPDVPSLMK